ncbi:MAG: V-type ATP synthase subunit I, partial [Acetomicrobium sp.]
MAIAKFCKLDLVVHESVRDEVISDLQKLGCCEIIKTQRTDGDMPQLESLKNLDEKLSEARFVIRFLEPYYEDEGDKIARLLGNKPKVSLDEMVELEKSLDLVDYSAKLRELDKKLSEIGAELSKLKAAEEVLVKIKDFSLPLSLLTEGTEYITGLIATVPVEQIGVLKTELGGFLKPDEGEFHISMPAEKDKEVYAIAIFIRKKNEEIR